MTQSSATGTPVRALGSPHPCGYRLLRDVGSTYRDGAEDAVLRIVSEADDRSASSDELIRSAQGWAQRYHLDPARTNVVRALDLPADARVLEIGAGCGAVTRHLGERCAVVDALEPVPARAEAAAARTADLPGVQVLVGELDDVPAEPTYDVVVVVGVLEYVGGGAAAVQPYLDFLAGIRARLVPGGTLVLAIENKLGVKYLAGSPEDHTNRVFDSLEGYPRGGKARTFSRRELEGMFRTVGLAPRTLVAFPDYKMTRAVLGEFPETARSLLHRIPVFPSPDWRAARPRMADERASWAELVGAGLEQDFGNSFVVLATTGADVPSPLWPATRAGVFFSTERRKHLEVRTEVVTVGESVQFVRTARDGAVADLPGVRVRESVLPYRPGTDLAHVVAAGGVAAFAPYATRWLELLDDALANDPGWVVDLVPHNLVVTDDGGLAVIDNEFAEFPIARDRVVRRGIFWFANACAALAVPERWKPARTVGELMVELGTAVGLPDDGSWLEQTVRDEADFLSQVRPGPPTGTTHADWLADLETRMRRRVARPLTAGPAGTRVWEERKALDGQVRTLREERARLQRELSATKRKHEAAEKARARLASSPEQRAGRRLRRVAEVLLPPGTQRRARVRRSLRR